ncbi:MULTISPECIES: NAD(P)H-dependent oxidoreductase [Ramlibacter]|uniref:Flavodoxin family protein n=1 Tax=Ramlibacter pinisoli TaxID=2682844 RepID=A0A6N8IXT8_9BURK|nr:MULTISPECIES: NAD(P)H-dependent oxidoreductase [Ramlibacter]MBA2960856.1 NAD(P)H-dependent oxidoreductase [Ramlibacter sp. CGMCC 1.13660]MVQ30803.1 flavodoxin family protein [Ramlibacter pinisoli]
MTRILLLQGHPDADSRHLCHALAASYAQGALSGGHEVRTVDVAALAFPLLRSQREWEQGALPEGLAEAQRLIGWAEHIVLFFPLWLGDMPAVLKGFLEQVARPGFAFKHEGQRTTFSRKGLTGRSARVVVTMGMPAVVYRWYFRAHSVKSLERNILGFVGIAPVKETLVGGVGELDPATAGQWLARLQALGIKAQ